ncbi:hypothetical protein BGW37DRAFT_487560 [Umbelopsis sp. PMI_123]|nr:hypothetical protein BGW37DRAFT_487560 [Umbelopsis sp. PMI_123]
MSEAGKKALIMGATGAVGKALLREALLADTYKSVTTIGRREVKLDESIPQGKLVQKIVDFENLEASRSDLKGYEDVFCCLGTTRADAGDASTFRKIDHDYVVNTAKIIAEENPGSDGELSPVHFLYCSSGGSNKNSPFLYMQSKGQTECDLIDTGFKRVSIFRPGFLTVEEKRESRTPRIAENIFGKIVGFTRAIGLHLDVPVGVVGRSMLYAAAHPPDATSSSNKTTSQYIEHAEIEKTGA